MVWDFFKKKKEDEPDVFDDLVLSKMKPGFLVDYDMKTYEVTARNRYEWHEGGHADEWELKQGSEVLYLEREEEDGEVEWTLNRKMPISVLEGSIAQHIIDNEDPPEQVVYEGIKYFFVEDDIGEYFKGRSDNGLQFVVWDFTDERQEKLLAIEQWGENKFDVTFGKEVEEYQFSNILPSTK